MNRYLSIAKEKLRAVLIAISLAAAAMAPTAAMAAVGTVFVNTGGSATNSGTTDTASAVINGTAAAWTTGTAAITLDTNTNFATVPGCSAGTCDGSQAIYLVNATNTNQNIFWILSYTGCTGSGSCVVTVSINVSCSTCSANAWAIGGQYVYPSGATHDLVVNALRPGDTLQFDNSPASKSTTSFVNPASNAGSSAGFISVIGKAGQVVTLTQTGNANIIQLGQNDWFLGNLTLTSSGTSSIVSYNGQGTWIDNVRITGGGAGANGISASGAARATITNNEITGVGGAGISESSNTGAQTFISGNYIHDLTGDCILSSATTIFSGNIVGNLLKGCGGRGIFLSGAISGQTNGLNVYGNTIYGNTNSGIEVTNANGSMLVRNNIIVSTITAVATWKYAAGTAEAVGKHGYNVFWNSVDSNSGLSGVTLQSTETAADPKFINTASANFGIQNSSPAAGAGFPSAGSAFSTSGSAGYPDMGAIQRQVPASSGGGHIIGG